MYQGAVLGRSTSAEPEWTDTTKHSTGTVVACGQAGSRGSQWQICPVLNVLEQTVVALAAFDRRQSVESPGWFGRCIHKLLGRRPGMRLADARLEALRRYAVMTRLAGATVSGSERERFLAMGYSVRAAAEVERLTALVQAGR